MFAPKRSGFCEITEVPMLISAGAFGFVTDAAGSAKRISATIRQAKLILEIR